MKKINEMDKLLLLIGVFIIGGFMNIFIKSENISFLLSMGAIVTLTTYLMSWITKYMMPKSNDEES